jgi:predicted RNA-binding Zn-ribbon protein involved in translation (DUF1610 family)
MGITGAPSGDYFDFKCDKCGERTNNEYLGWDPSVPYFRSVCPKCGDLGTYKLDGSRWKGLPAKPDRE